MPNYIRTGLKVNGNSPYGSEFETFGSNHHKYVKRRYNSECLKSYVKHSGGK